MEPTRKIDRPYSLAVAWVRASERVRVAVSPQRESDLRRIAQLGDAWGLTLDDLGANFTQVCWLAGACAPAFVVERRARYEALVKFLRAGLGGKRAFLAMKGQHPKLGRAAVRAQRLAAKRPRAGAGREGAGR